MCINNVEKNRLPNIYIRLELCLSTFVYSRGLVVRVVDLRVRGLLEAGSWPCLCAQVKDGGDQQYFFSNGVHIFVHVQCFSIFHRFPT